jgi:hypothetical protein
MDYQEIKVKDPREIPMVGAFIAIWPSGYKDWYLSGERNWYFNGELHRLDGPAIEWPSGYKEWYLNGMLHRTDGPAVEWPDGSKAWYLNGVLHRTDGPAFEGPDGSKAWYLDGKELSYNQWRGERKVWLEQDAKEKIKEQVI